MSAQSALDLRRSAIEPSHFRFEAHGAAQNLLHRFRQHRSHHTYHHHGRPDHRREPEPANLHAATNAADPHKGSHAAVALGTDEVVLHKVRVRASAAQAERMMTWAQAWPERTWAVEGSQPRQRRGIAAGCPGLALGGYPTAVSRRAALHPAPTSSSGAHAAARNRRICASASITDSSLNSRRFGRCD